MRCATLEKKSHVSDAEINNLAEDRARLTNEVDRLELQVEEFQQKKDEADKQSAASGVQYMKIMGMSSKLQSQSAADLKKWKSDREAWQMEREDLLARLAVRATREGVSSDAPQPATTAVSAVLPPQEVVSAEEPPTCIESEDALASECVKALREEVLQLRKSCDEAHVALEAWREDSGDLKDLSGRLAALGERMQARGAEGTSGMGITGLSQASSMGTTRPELHTALSE